MPREQPAGRSGSGTPHAEGEYRIRRGQFEGTVRPHEDNYWFSVRDITRERPTIHGFGVDFQEGVKAVEQLVDLLERQAESKQKPAVNLPFDAQTNKIA